MKRTIMVKRKICFLLWILIAFINNNLVGQAAQRIGIRQDNGKARFYNLESGVRFVPRGFNYIQLVNSPVGPYGESELFQSDSHDQIAIDDDFQRMAALGYNVVRVFIDLCRDRRCIAAENGLDNVYINNIVRLLEQAETYNLHVMLTANWLPDIGGYSLPAHQLCESSGDFFGGNCLVMSAKGVELYSTFFSDFVIALKAAGAPMETIWAYELRNEFFVEHDQLPFTKKSGMVTTANGISYDMSSETGRVKMGEDALVFWANSTTKTIKELDPEALVTVGFFTPNEPNLLREGDPRIVPFKAALLQSDLDFFGIHAYAGFHDFQLEAENYGIIDYTAKPVVLGEYGAFLPSAPDEYLAAILADHWQSAACSYGVEGFTYWTWDRHRTSASNADDPWAGSDMGAFIGKVLSPLNKSNACEIQIPESNISKGKPTKSSMDWEGFPSSNVVDGNATATPWISGGDPPQWVEVDLINRYDLEAIQLVVETGSDEPFFYTHQIQVKSSQSADYKILHEFADERVNFEVLTFQNNDGSTIDNVRFIRITIPQAPGWAALHELRALLPHQRQKFDVPPPPILTYPRPALDKFEEPIIRWKNELPGLTATLQLANDLDFKDLIEEVTGITDDQYNLSHLSTTGPIYWRVMQRNSIGNSFWSVIGEIERNLTSIRHHELESIKLYPNPGKSLITIQFVKSVPKENRTITILSGTGSIVKRIKINDEHTISVDLSDLYPGLYFVEIRGDKHVQVKKLVKI